MDKKSEILVLDYGQSNYKKEFNCFIQSLDDDFRETLAIAVDRMSFWILDSLCISAGKVRKRSQVLLDTTRITEKQAFFQAVIEEVQKINGDT